MKIVKRDSFPGLYWPKLFDDFDDQSSQKGLKVYETEKNIIAEAIVAGVPVKDIDIHIEDGVLSIKAERSEESKNNEEFQFSSYQYYYTAALSGGQWDKTEASFEDGLIKITIPKTESSRPKKISISAKTK